MYRQFVWWQKMMKMIHILQSEFMQICYPAVICRKSKEKKTNKHKKTTQITFTLRASGAQSKSDKFQWTKVQRKQN